MSIDLNWETLTGGPDGAALAASIRDFVHTKFQAVPLPRFIKSVTVHDFQFGSIPPKVTLKDVCDPLPDFYEENEAADELDDEEDDEDDDGEGTGNAGDESVPDSIRAAERRRRDEQRRRLGLDRSHSYSPSSGSRAGGRSGSPAPEHSLSSLPPHIHTAGLRSAPGTPHDLGSPFFSGLGISTPGLPVPGGTANMHYFPSHIATGAPWSGAQTPLAAVAGAQGLNGWLEGTHHGHPLHSSSAPYGFAQGGPSPGGHGHGAATQGKGYEKGHHRNPSQSSISVGESPSATVPAPAPTPTLREKHSVSTLAPTSAGTSRPPTRDTALTSALKGSAIDEEYDLSDGVDADGDSIDGEDPAHTGKFREPRVEDMQAVFRIKYTGNVKLMLTAEILLDYPMPSFVGIPVKLNITGLSFDGVGVLAHIRKRVHFCFLSPEDAVAAVGDDDDSDEEESPDSSDSSNGHSEKPVPGRMGGLLQEIKVESEIGQREGTKQSLKNVGKVERFVLEQVRRIFEEEFVYPSFWTFLV